MGSDLFEDIYNLDFKKFAHPVKHKFKKRTECEHLPIFREKLDTPFKTTQKQNI